MKRFLKAPFVLVAAVVAAGVIYLVAFTGSSELTPRSLGEFIEDIEVEGLDQHLHGERAYPSAGSGHREVAD